MEKVTSTEQKVLECIIGSLGGVFVVLLLGLTGCSGQTGWRVSFGVSPVKQIDDRQQLTQDVRTVKHKDGY